MSEDKKTAKKYFIWYNSNPDMTDNEKRADIDKTLQLFYPDFTHEQIIKERENYLSLRFSYKYPRTESRMLYKHTEKMTFDKLYKLFSRKRIKYDIQYFIAPIAFLVIAGPIISIFVPLLLDMDFIETRIQMLILFLLIAIITLVMAAKRAKISYQQKKQFGNEIKKREIKINCFRVLDSGVHIMEGIDYSYPCFYLILRNYNHKDKITLYCGRNEYEKYRKDDYLCEVASKDGKFLYTFHYGEWDYDEEMKSVLEKEIQKYK